MPFLPTDINGLLVFEPRVFEDSRGYFYEAYNAQTFTDAGVRYQFIQDNQSKSTYGV
ncbi:MAG: dTDP-4-dehydrorhamnose 3,5-epimerase family protein, partial [Flavisolibacter sp.]